MHRHRTVFNLKSRLRRGFTLIELLVVIAIIATLAALISPAVQSARRAADNATCINNLKQYGIAIANHEQSKGRLPYLYDNSLTRDPNPSSSLFEGTWQRALFPYMDQAQYHEALLQGAVNLTLPQNFQSKFMACPEDATAFKVNGKTSYVANMGYIAGSLYDGLDSGTLVGHTPSQAETGAIYDYQGGTGSRDPAQVFAATGVFVQSNNKGITPTLGKIAGQDGTTSTILVSENLQAGNWYGVDPAHYGFGARVDIAAVAGGNVNGMLTYLATNFPLAAGTIPDYQPNTETTAAEAQAPRASSGHIGSVNALFCDSHTAKISDTIDRGVYTRLLSSNGQQYGQRVDSGNSY